MVNQDGVITKSSKIIKFFGFIFNKPYNFSILQTYYRHEFKYFLKLWLENDGTKKAKKKVFSSFALVSIN